MPLLHTPNCRLARDPLLDAELDQLVKYRARQPRLQPAAHMNIGCGLAVRRGLDAQRMVGAGRHNVVQIGPEDQLLLAAFVRRR